MVSDAPGLVGKDGRRDLPAGLKERELLRLSLTKGDFAPHYRKVMKAIDARVSDYVERQDEESVHDFRTAIRRAQATVRLFPGGLRRAQSTKRFLKSAKAAERLSSRLRDFDIIKARIGTLPRSELRNALFVDLGDRRLELLKEAARTAKALSRNSLGKDLPGTVSTKSLEKRFSKVVSALARDINRALPVVIGDATKERALHRLRMKCKRLRYTLEVVHEDADRDALLKKLEQWSDELGAVHDWDVVLGYLMERPHRTRALVESAVRKREGEFQKFVTLNS